ncbi:hypothetical protein OEZ86_001733 [Tetradesmus obliquus]|nr:hypothetical protein OEZ86_001733 [Tetradesmus obliquus]
MEEPRRQAGEEPLVVVWQPDGSLAIGSDPERVTVKKERSAPPARIVPTPEEAAAAQRALEERRAEALLYQQTTLRRRRNIFLALTACDFFFFFGVLIYQAAAAHSLMSGIRMSTEQNDGFFATDERSSSDTIVVTSQGGSSSSNSSNSSNSSGIRQLVPLAWWINPSSLRLEDLVFSLVADIVAAAGAVQNRTAVLSLYCVVQVLSTTALSTVAGLSLSLFTAFRLVLLLLAFYLRSAIFTWIALQQAAELPLEPSTAARLQQMLSQPPQNSFLRMLFRPPRADSSSGARPEQQATAAAAGRSGSATEQQALVQHPVLPANVAVATAPDAHVAAHVPLPSAGVAGPASIARGSLEGQGSADIELAAGAAMHGSQQQHRLQQQGREHSE